MLFSKTNTIPNPACCAINISNNKMFTVIGAINDNAKALVLGINNSIANATSKLFTKAKKPVVNNKPAKVPALPGTCGGVGIKCKK